MIAQSNSPQYRPDVDGLRAVAVIAVLVHHVWPEFLPGGYVGVDVFFVISGFLITRLLLREMREDRFSLVGFYERRARRILPALFVVLTAVLAFAWFNLLPSDYVDVFETTLAAVFFSSNIGFWWILNESYFAPESKLNPLLHTWSLGVEEQFYILFPLLLFAVIRLWPKGLKPLLLSAFLVGLFVAEYELRRRSIAAFYLPQFRTWELLAGSLLVVAPAWNPQGKRALALLAMLGLLIIATSAIVYSPLTPFPGISAVAPVAGAMACIYAGSCGLASGAAYRMLTLRPVVYVGLISYSLYLWHWPIVAFTKYRIVEEFSIFTGLLVVLLSLGLASVTRRLIELPFRTGSEKQRKWPIGGFSVAVSAVLIVFSIAGIRADGYPLRVSMRALELDLLRSPHIPFKGCDSKIDFCRLGNPDAEPSLIFWGDSHMLAWAPAADRAASKAGHAALLAFANACPPMFDAESSRNWQCKYVVENLESRLEQQGHPVRAVVLAARWDYYLQGGILLKEGRTVSPDRVEEYLRSSISATVDRLVSMGITPVLIGTVPTYLRSVPRSLAVDAVRMDGSVPYLDPEVSRGDRIVQAVAKDKNIPYVSAHKYICGSRCELQWREGSLYRDDDHLSVLGALRFEGAIEESIANALTNRGGIEIQRRN